MPARVLDPLKVESLPASVQLMAQCAPFQCSEGAATVLDANPSVAMHLAAEGMRLPGPALERPVWVELLDREGSHILDYHGNAVGADATFYAPGERGAQTRSDGRLAVPDYPRPLTAFKFFLWRFQTDQELCKRFPRNILDARHSSCLYYPILAVPQGGQNLLYYSSNMLALYKLLHGINFPRSYKFIDLGCGIGAALFIASIFFDRVTGVEKAEILCRILDEAIDQFRAQELIGSGAVQMIQSDVNSLRPNYLKDFNIVYRNLPFSARSPEQFVLAFRCPAPGILIYEGGAEDELLDRSFVATC